jgi:PTH1 family peptidyl-tRNA hydrolase
MWLLVGLGNPGAAYQKTRHNVGFLVVDAWAARHQADDWRSRFGGLVARTTVAGNEVLVVKPQSYMNLSGRVVGPAAGFYKVPLDHVLVVHDDADLPLGTLRLKVGGGHGGHNGLRSLTADLGGAAFLRIRLGIGRQPGADLADFVLGSFAPDEKPALAAVVDTAVDAIDLIVDRGMTPAMNRFNGRTGREASEG